MMNKSNEKEYYIEPGQEWEIDLFKPEDAEGVVNLFLSVYGKEYPVKTYLDKERLTDENHAGTTISTVARTTKGDIVGHVALYQSAPFKKIYEAGAGVVHRDYRGGKGIFTRMTAHTQNVSANKFSVEAIFGEPVCNHIFSQKMTSNLGWITMALELDLMPASAYIAEKSASGRVSSFIDFKTLIPHPHRVFLPSQYRNELEYIYEGLDDERDMYVSQAPFPEEGFTCINTQIFDFAQVARLTVSKSGKDFSEIFFREEKSAESKGITLIEVWLNLSEPWIGETINLLRGKGYFFGGLLPRWFNEDGLLMLKTKHRPYWEEMQIYSERAIEITGFVRRDWEDRTRQSKEQ